MQLMKAISLILRYEGMVAIRLPIRSAHFCALSAGTLLQDYTSVPPRKLIYSDEGVGVRFDKHLAELSLKNTTQVLACMSSKGQR